MFTALPRRNRSRRGVTLVEMLVVVALVVLMMVILVQIFQSALGAMSASRTTQELDVSLRAIDSMIRSDLAGVTAKMTPPNDPALKQGYFEYGENAPADIQGEDTDDYLAFTTKAPEGQVFSGRQWLRKQVTVNNNPIDTINESIQPTAITSQVAEVIYFLRNGNLYRRVLLVVPKRQSSITNGYGATAGAYLTPIFGNSLNVSWQGMNDISCRPSGYFTSSATTPIPNDLGDLTNRENRAFRPRFINDFSSNANNGPDGIPDDLNGDGIPDYFPTLYYDGVGNLEGFNNVTYAWAPNRKVNENPLLPYPSVPANMVLWRTARSQANSYDVYAFPFIYPGMYSVPDPNRVGNGLGWVHYLPPNATTGYLNHSPLDIGETQTPDLSLPAGSGQTWWGFPTWRETMSGINSVGGIGWKDPITFVSNNSGVNKQPLGLSPFSPLTVPSPTSSTFLPIVHTLGTSAIPYGYDGAGSPNFVANPTSPNSVWEDDLIMTNVRSFDVKAYDGDAPLYNPTPPVARNAPYFSAGYQDLGYGSLSLTTFNTDYAVNSTVYGPNGQNGVNGTNQFDVPFQAVNSEPRGFGHEGRIPSIPGDFRLDPRRPFIGVSPTLNVPNNQIPNNIGDDRAGVIRLTRTFDTWSTDYVNSYVSDVLLHGNSASEVPVYPAFPPPYPSALRGIQIQIRVTDPRNERTKVLTIRHDFTDKLTN